jgi:SAM-dependent methyltransferase
VPVPRGVLTAQLLGADDRGARPAQGLVVRRLRLCVEQLDELREQERPLSWCTCFEHGGTDVSTLEADDHVGVAEVGAHEGAGAVSREVESEPIGLLERRAKWRRAVEVERPQRAHLDGQVTDELLDDRGRERAPEAVARADDHELEARRHFGRGNARRVDPRVQLVELIADAEQRLLELPRGRAPAHRLTITRSAGDAYCRPVPTLSPDAVAQLRCPGCGSPLEEAANTYRCTGCERTFPVVHGVPVLIDESSSLFTHADFVAERPTTWQPTSPLRQRVSRLLPSLSRNMKAEENYARLRELLLAGGGEGRPRVLVIGGSRVGQGMDDFANDPRLDLIESDVSFGPRTSLVCDAHRLPFADRSVDAVVAQAVLQALVDPLAGVAEIHRVLRPGGYVYAETPFMQQVFGGRFDFTRYTHLGHRRLFREFEEVASGPVCGPGMALAWSYQYFLLSFFERPRARTAVKGFTRVTAFWLKYFDHHLIDRPGGIDAASGVYFLGRRSETPLPDDELIAEYRGAVPL